MLDELGSCCKVDYRRKIETHFSNNDTSRCGRDYRTSLTAGTVLRMTSGFMSMSLAEELNSFFAHFESPLTQSNPAPTSFLHSCFNVQEHDVKQVLQAVNPRKAAGPDAVPGNMLRVCAHQLTPMFW